MTEDWENEGGAVLQDCPFCQKQGVVFDRIRGLFRCILCLKFVEPDDEARLGLTA